MNAAGDYSSAYCILSTDSEFSGHGMVSWIFSVSIESPIPKAQDQYVCDFASMFSIALSTLAHHAYIGQSQTTMDFFSLDFLQY